MNNKIKTFFKNSLLVLISTSITFIAVEFIFQKTLFDLNNKAFDKYRRPTLYAADWDENYWKLLKVWHITPVNHRYHHPLVGWLNYMWWPKSLMHPEVLKIENKRPVLLYGDSYAQHFDTAQSIKNIMYGDSVFNNDFHFINYGCGAYGVDQIYTLFKSTYCRIENPIVIFSFLTLDLDRSALTFRDGQKPHYSIDETGQLSLDTTPFFASDIAYIKKYPPNITSYLWRKFLYSDINILPEKATEFFTGELEKKNEIIKLNSKIIENVISLLRGSNTDFVFLLWEAPHDFKGPDKDSWRKNFIEELLNKKKIKYIWAQEFLPEKLNLNDTSTFYKYYVKDDGHPTVYFYQFVANAIKKVVSNKAYEINSNQSNSKTTSYLCHPTFKEEVDSIINVIKTDSILFKEAQKKSIEKNESLAKSVYDFALYFLWQRDGKRE